MGEGVDISCGDLHGRLRSGRGEGCNKYNCVNVGMFITSVANNRKKGAVDKSVLHQVQRAKGNLRMIQW